MAFAAFVGLTRAAAGQGLLDQFSYEGLRFTAIGMEIGAVATDRTTTEASGAVRVHLGYFAPRVRLLVGGSYVRARFSPDEVARFEERVRSLVSDPTGDATVNVGEVTLGDLQAAIDLQYVFGVRRRVRPYAGLGLGIHVRDGDGDAIDGTFLEDALDTIAAGASVSLGVELGVTRELYFTVDVRGELTSEIRGAAARGGLTFYLPRD